MRTLLVAVIGLSSAPLHAEEPAGWPQWRGPDRDGRIEADAWPESLDESHLTQTWRVELGPSYSGPIVVGDRVFTTETKDEESEVVRALDRATGKEVWSRSWPGAMSVPFFARANGSWIRSTPAYDDGRLYVAGMRDVLVCLDAKSGEELWRRDFVADAKTPLPAFGFVCSPLVHGDHVYVQAAGAFLKLDKRTGETVWTALGDGGGMFGSAFSSPTIATLAGRDQLLVQTRTKLTGVDSADGTVLWSREIPAFRGMNILTPTVLGDRVFTSSYGGGSFLYEIAATDDGLAAREVWKQRAEGYMSSPVVIGNHAYLHLRNQRFTCIDLGTGESTWTTEPFGKYWSLVANGDRLLALDERGELLLIRADPEKFDLLDRRRLAPRNTWAHIAVVGNEVFVRELDAMTGYRWD